MKKSFREIEKEQLNISLPPDLVSKVREKADRKGWSFSRTVTEALSRGMALDPAEYGIEAEKQSA